MPRDIKGPAKSGLLCYESIEKFMKSKILSKRILLVVVLIGFVLFLVLLLYFIPKRLTQNSSASLIENSVALPKQEEVNSGLPVRLKIPGINVDATVEYVGVVSNGAMDVPKKPNNVAWFKLGPRPGAIGSAVIAGHYGRWKNGEGSVFDNLNKLRQGDSLYVEDEKGVTTTFVVREFRMYNENDNTSSVFNSGDGKAHLNLITCAGNFNKISENYPKRLVIFADKE